MGQMGFYDLANRYAGLDAKNEPLVKIDEAVPWEDFRGRLEAVWPPSAATCCAIIDFAEPGGPQTIAG